MVVGIGGSRCVWGTLPAFWYLSASILVIFGLGLFVALGFDNSISLARRFRGMPNLPVEFSQLLLNFWPVGIHGKNIGSSMFAVVPKREQSALVLRTRPASISPINCWLAPIAFARAP